MGLGRGGVVREMGAEQLANAADRWCISQGNKSLLSPVVFPLFFLVTFFCDTVPNAFLLLGHRKHAARWICKNQINFVDDS